MKRDLVYLNDDRDIVSVNEATWTVETFRDNDGKVTRETWGKVKSISGQPTPGAEALNSLQSVPSKPTGDGTPAMVPKPNKLAILTGFAALLLAIISARFALPDILTGLLAGAGLGISLYALFGRQ